MMFTTRTIDESHTPLLVGEFYDDAVIARTPSGEILRVSRFFIETPQLCCSNCGKAALLKHDKRQRKDYAECPDHARHMYDAMFAASHDTKQYNRKQRHKFYAQAVHWLGVWQRVFESRTNQKVDHTLVEAEGSVK